MAQTSVWCICMGVGYPGLAPAHRMTLVGRALQAAGCRFRVCHLGANPLRETPVSGTHDGIPFQYYPANVTYSQSRWVRQIAYLRGLRQLLEDLIVARRNGENIVVYSWLIPHPATVLFCYVLRRMFIPIVTEQNEWWPGVFARLQRIISVLQSDGLLVISDAIEKRIRLILPGRPKPILTIPILMDVYKITPADMCPEMGKHPYFIWCGDAASSLKDICFMLDIMAELAKRSCVARLVIAGRSTGKFLSEVRSFMHDRSIPDGMVDVAGYLPDDQHACRMREACGLLLPLWADEERSVCRFPTKLGEYLATARPVITSPVGAVGAYLEPGPAAFLCPSGDVCAYAAAAEVIIRDPFKAEEIGRKGRRVAEEYFDFRKYSTALNAFFNTWCDE